MKSNFKPIIKPIIKLGIEKKDPAGLSGSQVVVMLFSEDKSGLKNRPDLKGLKGLINPRLKNKDFKGKFLEGLSLFPEEKNSPHRVILLGLGSKKDMDTRKLRKAGASAAKHLMSSRAGKALVAPGFASFSSHLEQLETIASGATLGQYDPGHLKSKKEKEITGTELKRLDFYINPEVYPKLKPTALRRTLRKAEISAEAISYARDLINRPANLLKPADLASEARKLARKTGLKVRVITPLEARKKKMGAFLAVGKGSNASARMIVLEYLGGQAKDKPLVLVGKAITFDSGGLSLKPPASMVNQKTDMAGGAAVLSVLGAAARLGLKKNLVGIIPAAENMPSGNAYRPGDVITTMSGQTVEIISTDAEGRMVLADGLTFAHSFNPEAVIDLATLTGAVSVALGDKMAGIMSNDTRLTKNLIEAGKRSGELLWELPLFEDYMSQLKSDVADFKNSGGPKAGTIVGGLFLKQFVKEIPWAHLDIAGTGRADNGQPDQTPGATGFGVSLLLHFLTP